MTKEGSPAVGGYDDKLRAAFGLPQKQFGFDAMPGGRSNTQSNSPRQRQQRPSALGDCEWSPYFYLGVIKSFNKSMLYKLIHGDPDLNNYDYSCYTRNSFI